MHFPCASLFRSSIISVLILLSATGITHANVLLFDTPTAGSMAPSATVDYTIILPTPGHLTLSLTNWESTYNWGTDYDRAYMYNAAGESVAIEQFGSAEDPFCAHMMDADESFSISVGQAGTYTLRLHSGNTWDWPNGVTAQNYTIAASLIGTPDPNEPNETIGTSTPLALNTPMTAFQWRMTPSDSVRADEDVYRISLPSPGTLTITLADWISTYNWGDDYDRLYIYRADGTYFNVNNQEEYYAWMMGANAATTVNLSAGGDYYLRYHSGSGISTAPYTITCSFNPAHDAQEPNDGTSQATAVTSGVTYTAYQWKSTPQGPFIWGDEDWFSFTAGAGDAVITITDWLSTYDWGRDYDRAILYSEASPGVVGDEVFSQHMIGTSFTKTVALDAGRYLLNLHSGAGVQAIPYTLNVTFVGTTGVLADQPTPFTLDPVSPNPFNGATALSFSLSADGSTRLVVYSLTGQTVRTLVDSVLDAGRHRVVWDGRTDDGIMAASGVYLARLESGGMSRSTRMTFMK